MDSPEPLPDKWIRVLRRYLDIQRQEQALKEEKATLQEQLGRHMAEHRLSQWCPNLDGQPLKVRCQESTVVEYDETLLKERLGSRFNSILAPDPRKVRRNLARLADTLQPFMDLIGSPAPERVKAAIEAGTLTRDEFAGAFKKSIRRIVGVSRIPSAPPSTGGASPQPRE